MDKENAYIHNRELFSHKRNEVCIYAKHEGVTKICQSKPDMTERYIMTPLTRNIQNKQSHRNRE